jgi:hypothetical protein
MVKPQIYENTTLPIVQKYEGAHQKDDKYPEFFNDMGFVIRGRTEEGEDIHLWSFMYQQRGAEIIVDGDVSQTLCMVTKFSEEEKKTMHDIPYINKGQNIEDYAKIGEIKIDESNSDVTTWSTSDRKFICKPPHWRIEGDHAGVKADIDYTESSVGFFHLGSFEDLPDEGGHAGYIMHGKAEGTITMNGKTHKFKGYGVHERIIISGTVSDRTEYMGGRGLNWLHSWSEEFSFYCFKGDVGSGNFTGIVNVGKESFPVENHDGGIEELAYWLDPKSKLMIPYKWRVWANVPQGRLESEVWGYGRGYYTWIRKHGTMVVNQYLADSKSTFTFKDGRVLQAPQMAMIEHMRTLYRQPI